MWRTIRIKEEAYNIIKKIAKEEGKSMCEIVSRIVLEHMKAEKNQSENQSNFQTKSEKLLKIEKNKQGRINYFYNRQQGKDPMNLLSISDDGTIYIIKNVISSPDIAIALISALKHAVTLMRGGESFAPVLDDYVQLFEDIWYEEYVKSV